MKRGPTDGSFHNALVNNLPFEMHLPQHDFTRPATKLFKKKLNSEETPKEWSIPIKRVDNAAFHHYLCYSKHDDTKTWNQVCDKRQCLMS